MRTLENWTVLLCSKGHINTTMEKTDPTLEKKNTGKNYAHIPLKTA